VDYPISVPSIGLVGGKFVDEDPVAGTPGSLIPAQWGNAVTEEIINVIKDAGLTPDEEVNTQLRQAIRLIVVADGVTPGRLLNVRVFAANGTYIPTPGMKTCIVDAIAGGGAGGGTPATNASQFSVSGGAGAGARGKARFTAAQIGASQPVLIGQGGAVNIGSTGGAGGVTSLGSLFSLQGGLGSLTGTVVDSSITSFIAAGAAGGSSITGANISGERGAPGMLGVVSGGSFRAGTGGGPGGGLGGITADSAGVSAGPYGSGGAGATAVTNSPAKAGGAGSAGIMIIYEYS
jgi:hypothetical protein